MTDTIKALQDEIEAVKKKRRELLKQGGDDEYLEFVELRGVAKGLQTAVDLLTKERARELPY